MVSHIREEIEQEIVERRIKHLQSHRTVLEWLMKEKKLSKSSAYGYINGAQEKIKELYETTNKNAIAEAIQQLEQQQEDAKKNGMYKLAYNIRQEISKLQGLHTIKIDHTTNGESLNKINVIVQAAENQKQIEDNL